MKLASIASRNTLARKLFSVIFSIFYFVGKKGEKGESSKIEMANLEETVSDLQRNISKILGNHKMKRC